MREFLKDYEGKELTKEDIETIIAEVGKKHTSFKTEISNLKSEKSDLETQVKDLNTKIETLNSTITDKEESLKDLQTLTNENNNLKAEVQMYGTDVKKEFSKFVRTEVMAKVDDKTDFATALESYKKENPQFFGATSVKKVQSSPDLNGKGTETPTTNNTMNDIIRGAFISKE